MGRGDGPLIQIIVQPLVPAVAVSSTAIVRSLFSTKLGQAFNLANNTFMVSFVVTPENKTVRREQSSPLWENVTRIVRPAKG